MNTMWAIPRNERGNPLQQRLRGVLILLTAGIAVLVTTLLTALGNSGGLFGFELGAGRTALTVVVSLLVNSLVFTLAFRIATARRLRRSEVVPGAVAAAVVWQLLQWFGATYVGRVHGANATYGTFAIVLGLVAFLYVAAVGVVLCVEANVVRAAHLYPRALLTPFTDSVELTGADERAYSGYAWAQRHKGFQTVDVGFDGPEPEDEPSGHRPPDAARDTGRPAS
jgi:uncharacterized BrkB/YihY/UPF0761 family membrane protein